MYRWCSYCQHYLGEQEPFTDYALTHGICQACVTRGAATDDGAIARSRELAAFFRTLTDSAVVGDPMTVSQVLATGGTLALRPLDLLIGILQPILHDIGRRWEAGQVSAAFEGRFSALCDQVLAQLTAAQAAALDPAQPLILMMNAHWNRHTLGLRMAAFLMREQGLHVMALEPTPALTELPGVLASLRPATIGISVATEWQLPFVATVRELTSTLAPVPRVVVGGIAVRAGCNLPPGVERWDPISGWVLPPLTTPVDTVDA